MFAMILFGTLAKNVVAGSPRSIAPWTSTLCHEVAQHAVKRQAVIEAVARQLFEICDRLWNFVIEQLQAE